jgi:hypothetical protein
MSRLIKFPIASALALALVVAGLPTAAKASPPGSFGGYGGGFNWGSAAIGGAAALGALRNSRSNSGYNNNRLSPRSYTPNNNYTPRTHTQPNYVTPHVNVVPQANVVPKTNVLPRQIAPQPAITPVANTGTSKVLKLSPADIARMTAELKVKNNQLLDDLTQRINAGAQGAGLDAAAVANLRRLIDAVRQGVNNGTLTAADLVDLVNAVNGNLPRDILITIGQVAVNQQVIIWIANAQPGANPIPAGANVPIALVPGLPVGTIIPLGFGPTLVGLGNAADMIILGEGNVLQAAGLPAAVGPPVTDFDGPLTAGQVVLTNVGQDPVNYNVNQSPFSMQPTFKQDLTGGQTWTVEFDRGGSFGAAQYELTEGWYEFTPTEKGWELFKQSFDVTLENGNDFDFHYVLDNQRRVLAAGQADGLVGAFPPVLRFDNGDGQIKQKRLKDGTFRVAVTAGAALDLFPASSVPAAPQAEQFIAGAARPSATAATVGIGAPVAPAPTLSIGGTPSASSVAIKLPPGFRPLDPVALLAAVRDTKTAETQKLPPAFTMFAATKSAGGDGLK